MCDCLLSPVFSVPGSGRCFPVSGFVSMQANGQVFGREHWLLQVDRYCTCDHLARTEGDQAVVDLDRDLPSWKGVNLLYRLYWIRIISC